MLNEHALQAFSALARTQSFSKAAKIVGISQPALSIRIQNLEQELGTTLVQRTRGGITLTEAGQQLLNYAKVKSELEEDLLKRISSRKTAPFGGAIRIAGSSSVMRPVAFRALAKFIRSNPQTEIEFRVRDLADLESILLRGEMDFVLANSEAKNAKLECVHLGYERIVVIESSKYRQRDEVFLDSEPKDLFTDRYLQNQGYSVDYRRGYLQDEFGIQEGVALGFGRAVVHAHMIPKGLPVRIAKGFRAYREPVVLCFIKQPFYSQLHQAIVEELTANVPKYLEVL